MKCSLGISDILEEISSLFSFCCFPLCLCIDHWRRLSYLFLLFFGTLHSDAYIFPFLLCFLLLFFSQLFVRPPQTAILPFCISFPWGWSWSLSPVWMWELNCEEIWAPKNWCFWTVVLEKTLESPLNCKEIQPVHSKGDQSWVFTGRTEAEDETPILWPPHVKSWLTVKDSGRNWGQEEKGTTKNEIARWHHQLDAHEFGWTLEVGDGQGSLACCNSWSLKECDTTERLNWTELNW